nr:hypothetical protein [Tanacetum cinerariifolium]
MVAKEMRRIENWSNAFSCEVQALIRRIFLVGYGVLFDIMFVHDYTDYEYEADDNVTLISTLDVNVDDPNITMEEYIMFEDEKARKRKKVFNWETAKYGKIWYDEYVHDLRSVETEFPTIVFNDNLTLDETLSCEPTVSSLNDNEIDFRISFNESDDEDYM